MDDALKASRKRVKKSTNKWVRDQGKQYGRGSTRLMKAGFIACVLLFVVLLAGCQVGDWFRYPSPPQGSGNWAVVVAPQRIIEMAGTHESDDAVSATDNFCRLTSACLFWSTPNEQYWHLHVYHDLQPNGTWYVHDGDWHEWRTCELFHEMETNVNCMNDITVTGPRG